MRIDDRGQTDDQPWTVMLLGLIPVLYYRLRSIWMMFDLLDLFLSARTYLIYLLELIPQIQCVSVRHLFGPRKYVGGDRNVC